jgi:hypothetical protein
MIEGLTVTAAEEAVALRRRPEVVRRGRTMRRRRRVVPAAAGAVVLAGVAAVVVSATTDSGTDRVRTFDSPTTSPSSEPPARPASVTGLEQRLGAIDVPPAIDRILRGGSPMVEPCPGTVRAFSVDGSEGFVTMDGRSSGAITGSPSMEFAVGVYEADGAGGFGLGIQSIPIPLTEVQAGRPAVFLLGLGADQGNQGYAWSHLPADAEFVTYTWESVHRWVRPIDGVAAFMMRRPAQFNGPTYADWHTAAVPILRAFDADGNQIAEAKAPRVIGDDFVVSPDAPTK